MIEWIKQLEHKVDNPDFIEYDKISTLKERKFQGNLRINFNKGEISSLNLYSTIVI